jgi:hypothetical protein
MQQSPLLCFLSVDSLPLGDRNFFCPVATPEPRESVLQDSRRMLEQILTFGAFCANIEAHLLLMKCPIHESPSMWGMESNDLTQIAYVDFTPMSVMAMLRQLSARLFPPAVSLSQIRHSRSGNFICRRSIIEPEPVAVFTRARRAQSWSVVGTVPGSDSTRRNMPTPRHCDALGGAVGNFDYEPPAPPVELNCQKINPILRGTSEVWQRSLEPSFSEGGHE